MDPSPSMLHLAMAAFFGASLMAISALFIHKRSVDQLLERLIELRRGNVGFRDHRFMDVEEEEDEKQEIEREEDCCERELNEGFDLQDDDGGEERECRGKAWSYVHGGGGPRENISSMNMMISSYGFSSSVPNVGGFSSDWVEDECNNRGVASSLDKSHLPLLQRYLRNGNGCSSKTSTSQNIKRSRFDNKVTSNGQPEKVQNDAVPSQKRNNLNADSDGKLQQSPLAAGHMQDQKSKVAACERKAILDLPANVELDMPSTGAGGNDYTAETSLPLKAAMPDFLLGENTKRTVHNKLIRHVDIGK